MPQHPIKPVPPVPKKPRLGRGETAQSPAFKKRMLDYRDKLDLREATIMQNKQREAEIAANAKRDVLEEAKTQKAPKTAEEAVDQGVAEADEAARRRQTKPDTTKRRKRIDQEVEGAQTGHKPPEEN